MDKCLKRLLRIDSIRLIKLLEIIYYTIISFIFTIIATNILEDDKLVSSVFNKYDYSEASVYTLLKDIVIDLSILCIYLYYLKKFLSCIPSLPGYFNKKYTSNKKNEVNIGISLGTGIIIYTALPTIKNKLSALDIKIKKYIDLIFL